MKQHGISVPISPGELIDKITILEIKCERLPATLTAAPELELRLLRQARDQQLTLSTAIVRLSDELKSVNAALWDVEDAIRRCEAQMDFGQTFIALARSIYHQNDRRAALKREINETLDCDLREVKFYSGS